MIVSKYISSTIKNAFRVIKVICFGKLDVREASEVAPFGIDTNPIAGMQALYADTQSNGKPVIIGYVNNNQKAGPGEVRVYSVDSNGTEKFYAWMKSDGTYEIGGSDDNMVRFSKLKSEFNEMKGVLNDMVSKWNLFAVAYVPGSPSTTGLPASLSGSTITPSAANIDLAKITKVKTIGSES